MTLNRLQRPQTWTLAPFRKITTLRDEVDQLFDYAFGRLLGADGGEQGAPLLEAWGPTIDLFEDKEAVTVNAELPGLKREDIELNLRDGFLTISGERKREEKSETKELYRSERSWGRFQRTVSLPCEVEADKIKAAYTNGVLSVVLPKAEKAKPRQIPIAVN